MGKSPRRARSPPRVRDQQVTWRGSGPCVRRPTTQTPYHQFKNASRGMIAVHQINRSQAGGILCLLGCPWVARSRTIRRASRRDLWITTRWTLMVLSTVPRRAAICLLRRPEMTCFRTSCSRGVNQACDWSGLACRLLLLVLLALLPRSDFCSSQPPFDSDNDVGQGCQELGDTEDDDAVMNPDSKSLRFVDHVAIDLYPAGRDQGQTDKEVSHRMIDESLESLQKPFHADKSALCPVPHRGSRQAIVLRRSRRDNYPERKP